MRFIRTAAAVITAAILVAGTVPAMAARPVPRPPHCSIEQPFRAHGDGPASIDAVRQPSKCVVGPA